MRVPIRRALVSVSDKRGVVELCRELAAEGVQIVSTGGTAAALREASVTVIPIEEVTGFPEMLDGRVKTLHPAIHGGILALRSRADHLSSIGEKQIEPIDLVVVNLYPFEETVSRSDVTLAEAIENIDIGGPSMVRSAAKNWESVAVLTDPDDYDRVVEEIRHGGTTAETRFSLAARAFQLTARYDAAIARYFETRSGKSDSAVEGMPAASPFPDRLTLTLEKSAELRYGENPHQRGAFYRYRGEPVGLAAMTQLAGKELSYLNLFDVNGALELAWEFKDRPAAVIVKHASPCGVALADTLVDAYRRAYECDPVSAFGGIVALNRTFDVATAEYMMGHIAQGTFLEVIAAPDADPDAVEFVSSRRKNVRILRVPLPGPARGCDRTQLRSVRGGVLAQEPDEGHLDLSDARCVTARQPTPDERAQLAFAWTVVKHVKSNAVAICRDFQSVGLGGGQTDRWRATRAAVHNAGDRAEGGVMASDAFFPFPDGPEEAARAGITAIVQPGGSRGDSSVIELADRYNIAMLFTGARHFRH